MTKLKSFVVKWTTYVLLALVVISVLVMAVVTVQARQFSQSDVIAHNVSIGGVPMGDLPRAAALQRLNDEWLPQLPAKFKLTCSGRTFEYTAHELGRTAELGKALDQALLVGREGNIFSQLATRVRLLQSKVDIAVPVTVNAVALHAKLKEIAHQIDRSPVNARVTVTGLASVGVVAGRPGLKMDMKASQEAVTKALKGLQEDAVALTAVEKQPAITAKDLADLNTVLGRYSTPYSASKTDRTQNLKLAITAINGTVVMPGETFSADKAIGPRIEERGFREAPIFAEGDITPATGGGICQIATTIYNAVLYAGLPVVERHHHSQPVHYAPAGQDATVYAGQLDLRFVNDTGYPIVVLGSMDGRSVHVNIIGKKEAKVSVRLERSGITSTDFQVQEMPDPTLPVGKQVIDQKGRNGIKVSVYQIIKKQDGTEDRRLLHTDVYGAAKQIVRVGTKPVPVPVGPDGKPLQPQLGPNGKPLPVKPPAVKTTGTQTAQPAKPVAAKMANKKPSQVKAKPVKYH